MPSTYRRIPHCDFSCSALQRMLEMQTGIPQTQSRTLDLPHSVCNHCNHHLHETCEHVRAKSDDETNTAEDACRPDETEHTTSLEQSGILVYLHLVVSVFGFACMTFSSSLHHDNCSSPLT